jgi:arylsulfatase B
MKPLARRFARLFLPLAAAALATPLPAAAAPAPNPPNIVLIITDDQGYGDLGHTGNPVVRTPHLDRLAAESSRLTDFHVAPTCSPTRAALMTGRWTNRTGVWHTVNGRSMLRENEVTFAQLLRDRGYATGLFGKWHLGDNFPYRAEDRGFTEVYRHGGGGVGQTPDLWDNAYFDGRYFHNGKVVAAKGFCTDVFFGAAENFIRDTAARRQPWMAYIALNAPHGPLHAPEEWLARYPDQPPARAAFYAMISNIDDRVGRLRTLLRELGVERDTVFVFTTDNGTANGEAVFNAGMRGKKGSEYDGGHRVPFIAHWPAGGWNRPHTSATLTHAIDVLPTLLDVAGATPPPGLRLDGRSLRPLLDPAAKATDWPDRLIITDSQRVRDPVKWKQSAVMAQEWRLVNGKELYAIQRDPGQKEDVAARHPEQVARMRAFYEAWWAELEPTFALTTEIPIGHPQHPVVSLTAHDWIQEDLPPWNQQHIRQAQGLRSGGSAGKKARPAEAGPAVHRGHWALRVERAGTYAISLRRWPVEADQPITAGLAPGENVPGADQAFRARPGTPVAATEAILRAGGRELGRQPIPDGAREVTFTTRLEAGPLALAPVFRLPAGDELGAYYAVVTFVR